jgi:hypothetical protein
MDSNLALYSAAAGFLLPNAFALIAGEKWQPKMKSLLAFVACIVVAVPLAYLQGKFQGKLTVDSFVGSALIVFTLARASYAALWIPTGVVGKLEAVRGGPRPRDIVSRPAPKPEYAPDESDQEFVASSTAGKTRRGP